MKRAVMTALVVTLLSGTSALAQGPLARAAREAQDQQRSAPPQRESRPQEQQQPQQRPQQQQQAAPAPSQAREARGGDDGRRGRDSSQPAMAGAVQAQAQRQQGGWQGQARPDGQGRPQGQQYQGQQYQGRQGQTQGQQYQGQRGSDWRQGQARPDGQYDRDRRQDEGPLARAAREAQSRQSYSNGRPGWNNDQRGDQGRRPTIRPEDRRDRDRNRPQYDQRRYPHYVTPYQRYRWIGPSYRLPPGFYSFRWQFGQTLPWNWYTPNYYLNDYWSYGLPIPPVGCEWVRVGDDAILVDVFTGRVYQVVYNLFW